MSEETEEPAVVCPRCDNMTDASPGHVVQDGKVQRCPFINVDISYLSRAPKSREERLAEGK